ncbi:MAG: hypothetical protein JO246_14090 [Frankiaceae bacterium]|nr:hypothetical protein [Frankiaceae bacterium]MBV9872491.1 hypothetical protein [Frankiaceae bacterium]
MTFIRVTGTDAIEKALEQLDGKDRQNALRRGVRAATKPFITAMKEVARSSNVPRSFQKIPAAKVSTRGGASGREVGATVRPASPLFNIFEPGAGEHEIAGDLMVGAAGSGSWSSEGRKRPSAFAARGSVTHPGMTARPITPRAFSMGEEAATKALADVLLGAAGGGAQ